MEEKPNWSTVPFILPEHGPSRKRIELWFRRHHINNPVIYATVSGHEAIVSMVALGCGIALIVYFQHLMLRIVVLSRSSVYEQLHLAHAYALRPAQLVRQEELATGLLPDQAQLEALIRHLNLSPSHHVVVYDDEGGAWAGRLIWTLHCLGFTQTSLLKIRRSRINF